MDLLTQSQLVDKDNPDAAAVAEKIVINNHNAIQAAGCCDPAEANKGGGNVRSLWQE